MKILGLVLLAGMALTACGNEVGAAGDTTGSPVGTSYLSVRVTEDGKDKQLVRGTRLRLDFTRDGTLGFHAGCNQMGGEASLNGGTLAMTAYGGTEMSCGAAVDAQEKWFGELLSEGPTWKVEGDRLTITRGSTTIVLQDREVVEPDVPLAGTIWNVDGLVTKEIVDHYYSVPPATLTIVGGKVSGTTSCNQFHGTVTQSGTTLTFGDLIVTNEGCSGEALRLQDAVLARLKGKLTYTIDHDRMELRRADGTVGLDLVAGK
ncbi:MULTISPECIES: META domain-containing protein [unclassified Kribbella]|uniref:META domain-containing protein n=1 Tax=unclassified Kribbella TaxID=2644121 RepID=UPI0033F6BCFA